MVVAVSNPRVPTCLLAYVIECKRALDFEHKVEEVIYETPDSGRNRVHTIVDN